MANHDFREGKTIELAGKVLTILGDSITEAEIGVTDRRYAFRSRLKRDLKLKKVNNFSVCGSRFAHQSKPSPNPRYDLSFCGRVYLMDKTPDLILVFGGVNDYFHGDAPIGSVEDKTPESFCGAVNFLMDYLLENYPDSKIAFLTPEREYYKGVPDTVPCPRPMKLPDAMPLVGYVDIILERAKAHGIPALDLYRTLPIDPHKPEDFKTYYLDGLHLNNRGHAVVAKAIEQFLLSL